MDDAAMSKLYDSTVAELRKELGFECFLLVLLLYCSV